MDIHLTKNSRSMATSSQNEVAVITGGSNGIGRATAMAFAKLGVKVVVVDNIHGGDVVSKIIDGGGDAVFIPCDVSVSKDVREMFDQIIQIHGRIDYAFNNAGVEGIIASTHECTEDNWDRTISINLKGVWLCMKYEIQHMLKTGKGVIVNNSSVAGLIGFPGSPAYVASKHAIIGLTKTAALENARSGIRINAVCPGVIRTPMIDRITRSDAVAEKQFMDLEPMGRLGNPEEVAEAVVWLCSDSASFITGHSLPVDGGWLAG